jgi:hypothetical protein
LLWNSDVGSGCVPPRSRRQNATPSKAHGSDGGAPSPADPTAIHPLVEQTDAIPEIARWCFADRRAIQGRRP